jgi:hypothetical protein
MVVAAAVLCCACVCQAGWLAALFFLLAIVWDAVCVDVVVVVLVLIIVDTGWLAEMSRRRKERRSKRRGKLSWAESRSRR